MANGVIVVIMRRTQIILRYPPTPEGETITLDVRVPDNSELFRFWRQTQNEPVIKLMVAMELGHRVMKPEDAKRYKKDPLIFVAVGQHFLDDHTRWL